MTASQIYKQRVRDLVAFGAILTTMGIVALATDRICVAAKTGQVVRQEMAQPKDGHSFSPVPPTLRRTVIIHDGWPDPNPVQLTKYKPVAF